VKIIVSERSSITLLPFLHGKIAFTEHLRRWCLDNRFDCIAVDLPSPFEASLAEAVDDLPVISAIIARAGDGPVFFVPIDPCDAAIEAVRQSRQNHVPFFCLGSGHLDPSAPLPPLPDEYAINQLGFDEYTSLCLRVIGNPGSESPWDEEARFIADELNRLKQNHVNILALVHMRHCAATIRYLGRKNARHRSFPSPTRFTMQRDCINPDHLFFVLGELPFITGKYEKTRYDPLAGAIDMIACIKDLFRETRDNYNETREESLGLSPARIQRGLQFLRNLTVREHRFMPTLFDIVTAAKGIGGNAYALNILKCARYYPYLPLDLDTPLVSMGIDKIILPGEQSPREAINCLRDFSFTWRRLSLKPDPTELRKKKYRFSWDPRGMCSHVPEDQRIENFNRHLRGKATLLREDAAVTEKFMASVLDGIDIRETVSKWYTGDIYVKRLPPSRGAIDTVIIIFDDGRDERYPHCGTWYAEHDEESTLTFYSTDPFDNIIGPGICRSYYGGLSLLFPPRLVPNVFEIELTPPPVNFAEQLTYGALFFSGERRVAYVAKSKPSARMRGLAARLKKRLVWIPLTSFSAETLNKLRTFHVLNGKEVRSWAARFI
jgi:hypothetical protein